VEAFGGATAQALSGFGKSLGETAGHLENIQSFYDQVVVDEQKNSYENKVNNKLYGDPSVAGDVGYMGLQGKNALEAREGVRRDIDGMLSEHRSTLKNANQLRIFDQDANRYRNATLNLVGRHYDEQYNKHAAETADSTYKLKLHEGAQAANNNDFGRMRTSLESALVASEQALRLKGADDATIALHRAKTVEAFTATWAFNAIERNAPEGKQFVLEHKDELGDKYDELLHKATTASTQYDVDRMKNGLPPITSQPNLVRGGHLNYGATGELGDPRSPGWEAANIVEARSPSGSVFRVHKQAKADVEGFLKELEGTGYKINSAGGHALRNITGGTTLSEHAYGTAIDINPDKNPYLPQGGQRITDLPSNVAALAAKYNLEWGGNWKQPIDSMHFQWRPPGGPAGLGTPSNNLGGMRAPGPPKTAAEGGFQSFPTPEAGIQAIAQNLTRYSAGGVVTATNPTGAPLNTVRGIVSTWAPASENNTAALIDKAVQHTGFGPDQVLDLSKRDVMTKMVEAVVLNEQGKLTSDHKSLITRALALKPEDVAAPTVSAVPSVTDGSGGSMPSLPPNEAGELPDGEVPGLLEKLKQGAKLLPPGAKPEVWNAYVRSVRQDANMAYNQQMHQERQRTIAQQHADQTIGDQYYERIAPGSANMPSEAEILKDTRISQEKRKDIINVMHALNKKDPDPAVANNNMVEAYKGLGLKEGEEGRIYRKEQIDQLYTDKKITWDMRRELQSHLEAQQGAKRQYIQPHITQLLKDAERVLFPLKHMKDGIGLQMDPDAPMRERRYQNFVENTVQDYITSGKDVRKLFDPGSPDKPNPEYLGNRALLDEFGKGAKQFGRGQANTVFPAEGELKNNADIGKAHREGRFGVFGTPEALEAAKQYSIRAGLGGRRAPPVESGVPMR